MSFTLKTVLAKVARDRELGSADRDHLKRWAAYGNDIDWEKLEADAEARELLPIGSVHETVIRYSLMTRRIAEAAKLGDDPLFAEKKQHRDSLLALDSPKSPHHRLTLKPPPPIRHAPFDH